MKHGNIIIESNGKVTSGTLVDLVLRRAIKSLAGRAKIAAAMAAPIRRNLNYHNLARNVLQIQPLPQGALPTYDRNIDVASIVVESGFKNDRLRIDSSGKCLLRK